MKKFKRIYVEITNVCNLNCRFCEPTKRAQKFMEIKDIEYVFEQIKAYTDYVYLHVKGEPLLHPELKNILKIAEKNNLQVIITTNGTLLNQKQEILSKARNIRQINISLHSMEQNSLKTDNEKYLLELFNAVSEIVKGNNSYISYRLWNLENIQDASKNIEILNSISKYYNISEIFQKIKEKDFLKLDSNIYLNLDTIYEWPNLEKKIISEKGSCYGLIQQIAILVDGTVVPCCLDQNGDINLGNIFENRLENILDSLKAKEVVEGFKKQILVNPLCQRCGFREKKRR